MQLVLVNLKLILILNISLNFRSKFNLNFDLVADPDKKIISSYGVLNEKGSANRKSFLIDEQGKILFIWDKVKAASHGEEVLSFPKFITNLVISNKKD